MHLDGVADTADAWVGGLGDHARTLEILKDPRVGAMGVSAMLVVLLVKFAAITALLEKTHNNLWLLLGGLLLIPILARAGIIGLMATTSYVRKKGMVVNTKNAATKTKVAVMGTCTANKASKVPINQSSGNGYFTGLVGCAYVAAPNPAGFTGLVGSIGRL